MPSETHWSRHEAISTGRLGSDIGSRTTDRMRLFCTDEVFDEVIGGGIADVRWRAELNDGGVSLNAVTLPFDQILR